MPFSHVIRALALWILLMTGVSCFRDVPEELVLPRWTPAWAGPLINSTTTLRQIVEEKGGNVQIETRADGFLTLVYFTELFSARASDLLPLPDTTLTAARLPAAPGTYSPNQPLPPQTIEAALPFQIPNARLSRMALKAGQLRMRLTSALRHRVQVTLTFPTFTRAGTSLTRTFDLDFAGTVPVVRTDSEDLTGYVAEFTPGDAGTSALPYRLTTTVTPRGGPVSGTDSLRLEVGFTDLAYSVLNGQFAFPDLLRLALDTIQLDIFDSRFDGEIIFEDPSVLTVFDNSFGVPLRARLTNLRTIPLNGNTVTLAGPGVESLADFGVAAAPTPGSSALTQRRLDRTNANVGAAFNPAPFWVTFQLDAFNATALVPGFVLDTSQLRITAQTRLPAEGRIVSYTTSRFETLSLPPATNADTLTFRFDFTNGYPIAVRAQLYFLNEAGQVLDSLLTDTDGTGTAGLLGPAPVDGTGRVRESVASTEFFVFDRPRYRRLFEEATQIEVRTRLQSLEGGLRTVRLFDDYQTNVRCGLVVRADVEL